MPETNERVYIEDGEETRLEKELARWCAEERERKSEEGAWRMKLRKGEETCAWLRSWAAWEGPTGEFHERLQAAERWKTKQLFEWSARSPELQSRLARVTSEIQKTRAVLEGLRWERAGGTEPGWENTTSAEERRCEEEVSKLRAEERRVAADHAVWWKKYQEVDRACKEAFDRYCKRTGPPVPLGDPRVQERRRSLNDPVNQELRKRWQEKDREKKDVGDRCFPLGHALHFMQGKISDLGKQLEWERQERRAALARWLASGQTPGVWSKPAVGDLWMGGSGAVEAKSDGWERVVRLRAEEARLGGEIAVLEQDQAQCAELVADRGEGGKLGAFDLSQWFPAVAEFAGTCQQLNERKLTECKDRQRKVRARLRTAIEELERHSWALLVRFRETPSPAAYQAARRAWHHLALLHHPDKGGSEETFRKIKQTFETAEAAYQESQKSGR